MTSPDVVLSQRETLTSPHLGHCLGYQGAEQKERGQTSPVVPDRHQPLALLSSAAEETETVAEGQIEECHGALANWNENVSCPVWLAGKNEKVISSEFGLLPVIASKSKKRKINF